MNIFYSGKPKRHFWIAIKNLALTVISLGMYRFWGQTNLRSYIWSHIEISVFKHPLMYHGTPQELLRAFLKALPFFLLFLFFEECLFFTSIYLEEFFTVVFLIWILCYANYSKHQYIYSRTSWKGIRFSLKGKRTEFANLCFKSFIKSFFTFGHNNHIYLTNINKYLYENVSWGKMPLKFTGKAEDLRKINNKIRLGWLGFSAFAVLCLVTNINIKYGRMIALFNLKTLFFSFLGCYLVFYIISDLTKNNRILRLRWLVFPALIVLFLFTNIEINQFKLISLFNVKTLFFGFIFCYFIFYISYELIFSFFCTRYALNHLAFEGVTLKVNYTFWQFIRFHSWNFILTIITLGLASPYVTYRNLKFIEKYFSLEGAMKDLETTQNTDETTGQDGVSSLLDLSDF